MIKYRNKLNVAFEFWIEASRHGHENVAERRMEFVHLLEKIKEKNIELVQIDFSVLPGFGKYNTLVLDELVLTLTKTRTEKNEKIDKREYKAALLLEEVEKSVRAEINREMCRKLFSGFKTFHSVGSRKLGFIYSGSAVQDLLLEQALRLAFRKIAVHHKQLIPDMVTLKKTPSNSGIHEFKRAA
jgi:hypothetical protein